MPKEDTGTGEEETQEEQCPSCPVTQSMHVNFETEEVKAMETAEQKHGNQLALYEFMQGMVDYGRECTDPPPRMYVVFEKAGRQMFTGPETLTIQDKIIAIEFINGGKGFAPDNVTSSEHEDPENKAICGLHGRGMKVAMACLLKKGMNTSMRSHIDGRTWSGYTLLLTEVSLRKNPKITPHIQWQYTGATRGKDENVIRINNPSPEICRGLKRADQLFLYANPRFSKAVIVPRADPQECLQSTTIQVGDKGEVICLDGLFEKQENEREHKHVFIDGLRIPTETRSALLWAVSGLAEDPNRWFEIKRSHTSSSIDEDNLVIVISSAVRKCNNEKIIRKIIEAAIQFPDVDYLELGHRRSWRVGEKFTRETAQIVQAVWMQKYGNSLIDCDPSKINWYRCQYGEGSAVLVSEALCRFLAGAGIKTVDQVMTERCIEDIGQDKQARLLTVDSVKDSDAGLSKLIESIAGARGTVELIETETRKKYLKFILPGVLRSVMDVNETQAEIPVGLFLKRAAIIGYVGEYDVKTFSITSGEMQIIYKIDIRPSIATETPNTFAPKITVTSDSRYAMPEYDSFEAGKTYILFDISHVNAYHQSENPDGRAGEIAQDFAAALAQIQEKAGIVKRIGLIRPESSDGYSCVGQTSICQVEVPFVPKHKDDIVPVGHYRSNVAAKFVFDEDDKQTQWLSKHRFIPVGIPRRKPPSFDSRLTITNIQGKEALRVPSGHIIVGAIANKGANVSFLRDFNTGVYQIKGTAQKVIYYTAKDPHGNQHMMIPPTADEQENFIDERFLNEQWRDFVVNMRSGEQSSNIEKILLAQEKWQEIFKYNADMEIDDLINKNSSDANQAATGILNCAKGICNVSATGFALLLRAIGVPSRVCMGTWVQHEDDGYGGRHMWVEAWTGSRWMPFEPGIGIETESTIRKRKATAEEVERTRKEYKLDGMPMETSPGNKSTKEIKEADMPPEEDPGRIVVLTRHELETLLTSDAVAIRQDMDGDHIILRYWIDNPSPESAVTKPRTVSLTEGDLDDLIGIVRRVNLDLTATIKNIDGRDVVVVGLKSTSAQS